jgi:carbonic anhydrase/acetyltransferase-like protein (isoleucine patch superfamily)
MPIIPYLDRQPEIDPSAFVAPDAWITGSVFIGEDSSVFFGSCLRGDINPIRIGKGTNVQELSILHTSRGLGDCILGDYVTIGHGAILHGCEVKNNCLIGMGATILDNVVVGEYSIVGANSLVPMNMIIPPRSMVYGNPAKIIREVTEKEMRGIEENAAHYIKVMRNYKAQLG